MRKSSIFDSYEYVNKNPKVYSWKDPEPLKGTYVNEHAGEVKVIKLSKEQIEEYLRLPKHEAEEYLKKNNNKK